MRNTICQIERGNEWPRKTKGPERKLGIYNISLNINCTLLLSSKVEIVVSLIPWSNVAVFGTGLVTNTDSGSRYLDRMLILLDITSGQYKLQYHWRKS